MNNMEAAFITGYLILINRAARVKICIEKLLERSAPLFNFAFVACWDRSLYSYSVEKCVKMSATPKERWWLFSPKRGELFTSGNIAILHKNIVAITWPRGSKWQIPFRPRVRNNPSAAAEVLLLSGGGGGDSERPYSLQMLSLDIYSRALAAGFSFGIRTIYVSQILAVERETRCHCACY